MTETLATGFDADALARLRRFGGDKLVADMIDLFLASAPDRLSAAREAMLARDTGAAGRALHAIKSSAGQLGASALQQLCIDGERLAKAGDARALDALAGPLTAAFDAARAHLAGARQGP
jgi:two-component system, sensor histidine kinase and response regulator